jgi:hypothetical protein
MSLSQAKLSTLGDKIDEKSVFTPKEEKKIKEVEVRKKK